MTNRALTIEEIETIAKQYVREVDNIEQDDLPTFTRYTVPRLIERLREAAEREEA